MWKDQKQAREENDFSTQKIASQLETQLLPVVNLQIFSSRRSTESAICWLKIHKSR